MVLVRVSFINVFTLLIIALTVVPQSGGAVEYAVMNIGTPYGYECFRPNDINAAGQIVGVAFGRDPNDADEYLLRGFLWERGVFTELPPLADYLSSEAWEINSTGQVVGKVYRINDEYPGTRTVIWLNGVCVDVAPSHDNGRQSHELGINDFGDIVGCFRKPDLSEPGFMIKDGIFTDIGSLGGGTKPASINIHGEVAGTSWSKEERTQRAFLWDTNTGMVKLDDVARETTLASAIAINDSGQIVGREWFYEEGDERLQDQAYIYDPLVGVIRLGTLGGTQSIPYSINNSGQVVGWSVCENERHAFLYDEESGMRDLNRLVDFFSGVLLNVARSVNDKGEIVGSGHIINLRKEVGLLLIPIQDGGDCENLKTNADEEFADFSTLVREWLSTGQIATDVYPRCGDGIVNFRDFAELADEWLLEVER